MSTMDNEISKWVEKSGYGTIVSSESLGSSDWASFRRLFVTNPPPKTTSSTGGDGESTSFFIKTSFKSNEDMFEGEALALKALYECSSRNEDEEEDDDVLCIPQVFYSGNCKDCRGSFLVMEYLKFGSSRSGQKNLGRAMAKLHLAAASEENGNPENKYGFPVNNTIGGTLQQNSWTSGGNADDWIAFFRDHRIGHQLRLAGDQRLIQQWEKDIAPRLHRLFDGITVRPSILHGDLWSGNIGWSNNRPIIFDPASYWGHHEAEWGMSWCANFGSDFWEGYRSILPKDIGFEDRKRLYDAYHQLNHYNLFGGFYLTKAARQLDQLKQILDKKEEKERKSIK